jgi:hypothetical protein
MMRKRKKMLPTTLFFMVAISLILFNSCYKDYDLSIASYDTVVTVYDEEDELTGYATYDIDEDWVDLNDPDNTASPPTNASTFLSAIRAEMANYGWTEVTSGSEDVLIKLAYSETDFFYSYCYPYWGWYYPPYWCGYSYSHSGGTAHIQLGDPNDPDEEGNIRALWHAGINGILNDTEKGKIDRINDTVAQAYAQSPYLDRN